MKYWRETETTRSSAHAITTARSAFQYRHGKMHGSKPAKRPLSSAVLTQHGGGRSRKGRLHTNVAIRGNGPELRLNSLVRGPERQCRLKPS